MKKKEKAEVTRWSFDTEDDSKGTVYWINFYDGQTHYSFRTFEKAVEWILLADNAEFWAVNLEYDMVNLFNALLDQICVLTYGGFGLLKASVYGKRIQFRNTLRHWPLSVEEMGDRLGYPKLPFDPQNLDYCKRDCEITYRFVREMIGRYEALGMEEIGATLPSTALKFYTKKFCQVNYQRHESLEVWKRLARARYGGRCEVFHTHAVESTVHEYDIVSSYPAAMYRERFPDLSTIDTSPSKPNMEREGVICCRVKSPSQEFPVLPWKHPDTGRLLFPIGSFKGTWTHAELRFALDRGYEIEEVFDCIEYQSMATPFKGYIQFLSDLRAEVKESDPLMSYVLKIAQNSTFGKFGEEGDLQIISRGKRYSMHQIPKHSNMIWASYILAYGRMALYRHMEAASKRGVLLYVDTDSVFVRCQKAPFGEGGKALGDLAYKGSYSYAHFKLPKLYRVDNHYKAKGVPFAKDTPEDQERLKREFFYDGVAEFMKPYRYMEARKLKEIPNLWRSTTKQLNADYDKREMLGGGNTWPLTIGASV